MAELSRDIDATLLAEYSKDCFYPAILVELAWPSETIRVHSGIGDLVSGALTFKGVGRFGDVTVADEDGGFLPQEAVLRLIGEYETLLGDLSSDAENGSAKIWIAATTEPGGTTLVGLPYRIFTGTVASDDLSPPVYDWRGEVVEDSRFEVTIRSGTHGRVRGEITHSAEDQQYTYSTDTLFARNARANALRVLEDPW